MRPVFGARTFKPTLFLTLIMACALFSFENYATAADTSATSSDTSDSGLSEEDRAQLVDGAVRYMNLDEASVAVKLKENPEFADLIPVDATFTEKTLDAVDQKATQTLAANQECKKKVATVNLVDRNEKPMLRWIATKSWCFSGQHVTSGNMNNVETWVRPDLRYTKAAGGYLYDKSLEMGTEQFATYRGVSRAAHKSSRAGGFAFYYPGETIPDGYSYVGIYQIGFYNGGCNSETYKALAPRISSGPVGGTASKKAEFKFSATPDAKFTCNLDGNGFKQCSSPLTYTSLANGEHVLLINGRTSDGNALPKAAPRIWTVDFQPPSVLRVFPADGATDVPANTDLKVFFSEKMSAFTLVGGAHLVKQGTTERLTMMYTYDANSGPANGGPLNLDPQENLEPGAKYILSVDGGLQGVKDQAGNALPENKNYSFTVAE